MKNISNILVAIDDNGNNDTQAFTGEVATIAKNANAKVTLLGILDLQPDQHQINGESADIRQWIKEDQQKEIKSICAELEKKGIQVTTKQSSGKQYMEIIREALSGHYDLIMKPAKSESTLKAILFGSTDMQLFRQCPYPIWAFNPTLNAELKKVVIAVDLLPYVPEKSALTDKILQWGKHVASLAGSELHVVHIWDLYKEELLRSRTVLAHIVDKLVEEEKQKHLQWLNDALVKNGLQTSELKIHFHKGEADELIPEITNELNADLLVMGTVGRTGIPGFFIGNTADSVLREVHCSVLAIKPDGFITPVQK